VVDVKFCGLTRAEDAQAAVALGAAYCGVIFAGGPRQLTVDRALLVLPSGIKRAAVFGDESPEAIGDSAARLGLDVVQLHADPTPATVEAVRRRFGGMVWAVVRCEGELPEGTGALFDVADAVLLDAKVAGAMGGTGTALPWAALARAVERARGGGRLVLAGGLTPENVGVAIQALSPDVVDVSSGVERAPGVKDQERMRRFVAAAHRGDSV
jgi:phosphoribosylanthranilate isomerase